MEECRCPQCRSTPLLIKPSVTEANYTSSVSEIVQWKHTQDRYIPCKLSLVLQNPSTPGKFDMWQNADISRADVPNRKSYIFYSCLQNTSIMQDQETRQLLPETDIMVQQASDVNHLYSPI